VYSISQQEEKGGHGFTWRRRLQNSFARLGIRQL